MSAADMKMVLPEMPRCMLLPMHTFLHPSSASCCSSSSTLSRFLAMLTSISSFISAVYSSISWTVRLSTSVSTHDHRLNNLASCCAFPSCSHPSSACLRGTRSDTGIEHSTLEYWDLAARESWKSLTQVPVSNSNAAVTSSHRLLYKSLFWTPPFCLCYVKHYGIGSSG